MRMNHDERQNSHHNCLHECLERREGHRYTADALEVDKLLHLLTLALDSLEVGLVRRCVGHVLLDEILEIAL